MASRQKRISNVRTYFLSPFRHIFKPKTEDLTKKPLTINLLTSYLRYKKHPLSNNLIDNLKSFLKSLNGKDRNSSSLVSMRNFMDQKKINTRNYKLIKRHFNKDNNYQNIINRINHSSKTESKKYNKRYKYLMSNLSFNGNNSHTSFKNISNNMLNEIFKHKPFISFDETNIKVVNKTPNKYKIFFKNISNQSKESNNSKEVDFSPISRRFSMKKDNMIGKKISFENKMLNKLSEGKEYDDMYSEKEYYLIKPKYLDYNKNNENSKEKKNIDKTEFYVDFNRLKQKIKKQNEPSDKIIKDIKRQQSLTKHEIQVGIVKLNEYKIKLRQFKKLHNAD